MFKSLISKVFLLNFVVSCASFNTDNEKKIAPTLNGDMKTEELVDAGVTFGGDILRNAKQIIKNRKDEKTAEALMRVKIIDNFQTWKTHELINGINMYQFMKPAKAEGIFDLLVNSDRELARELAWTLAASAPSREMSGKIDALFTKYIVNDELEVQLVAEMADAIVSNKMTSYYSVLRRGLFVTHEDSFAKAMIYLNPKKASNDFLEYLRLATPEELRQLTLANLNVFTCTVILEHLGNVSADISSPNFETLFLFATSRNVALSELGMKAIEQHLPNNIQRVAMTLSRMESYVQISYINNVSRNLLPLTKNLLIELKDITARNEVLYEIDSIKM